MPGNRLAASGAVHFITIGHSKEHVVKCIDELAVGSIVVFTSVELQEDVATFVDQLDERGVRTLEIITIDPFRPTAIEDFVGQALAAYDRYSSQEEVEVITGLTGGTNLMAIGMGTLALLKGLRCHYVLNQEGGGTMEIDLFHRMRDLMSREDIEAYLRRQ